MSLFCSRIGYDDGCGSPKTGSVLQKRWETNGDYLGMGSDLYSRSSTQEFASPRWGLHSWEVLGGLM